MIILYGAGKEFENIIKYCEPLYRQDILVVDTYFEKYQNGILGYEVNSPEILQTMTPDDIVIITSRKYYSEIKTYIKEINQEVAIYDDNAARWLLHKRNKISEYIKLEDKYEVHTNIEEWLESALSEELGYWERRIPEHRLRNDERFLKREFAYEYNEELSFTENDRILDVGCGPLPKFGNQINGKQISYIPVDPLAHHYQNLLKRLEITLPIEPEFAVMEMLTCFYKENTMDYVIVNNALDHCIDLLRGFIECLRVVKIGGCFLLEHMEAEGLHNEYIGLHKWNITCTDRDLICFDGKDMKINLSRMFQPYAEMEVKRMKQGYRDLIIVKITKKEDLPQHIIEKYDNQIWIGELTDKLFEKLLKETKK